jgi:protein TonB
LVVFRREAKTMGLQSSWQSDERDGRRYRQVIRDQQQKRVGNLRLVPPVAPPPAVVPAEFFRNHDVVVPRSKPLAYLFYGLAAVGVHVAVGWWLTHLPPGLLREQPKSSPVEMILTPPPEVEPPPPPPPPKEPPKVVKSEKVKVQHVVTNEPVVSDNVVAAEQGPITSQVIEPAPVVEEKVTAARADASYLNNPPPQYPPTALRQGWAGTVQLRVLVKPDGSAGDITVEKTSGKRVLDDAAIAAVKGWKFVPSKRGDTPIEGWVSFPVEFNLES